MTTGAPDPTISVVVPTLGRPQYLERCLAMLARSELDRESFEVIVVDDSSGNEIERVAEAASVSPRVVRSERTGPSGARNAGAAVARGDHVAFTDDDCEPSPRWLPALLEALADNPGAAVGGVTVNGAPDNPTAVASQAVVDAVHAQFNRDPDAPRFFASSNIAFPAEGFRDVGGFAETFRYAEDREMCERWLRTGHRFANAPDALVVHMRVMTLRQFWRQHYGYGRGASAFARARGDAGYRADRIRVIGEIGARATAGGTSLTAHLAISQAATIAGYARESVAALLRRNRDRRPR